MPNGTTDNGAGAKAGQLSPTSQRLRRRGKGQRCPAIDPRLRTAASYALLVESNDATLLACDISAAKVSSEIV